MPPPPLSPPPNATYSFVQQVATFVSEHCCESISLASLSQRFGVSQSYLSRSFKKLTGVGLNEYINISRITAAEKLLQSGNLSITEVAFSCGFNDSNYFAAVFKRVRGVTPKKYALQSKNKI